MMQSESKRIGYLDLVKCLAIWLVLWGHAMTGCMPIDWEQNRVFQLIYAFHMPLFMMVSGYFAEKSFESSLFQLFAKKFRQLLVPALFFGLIAFAINCCFYHNIALMALAREEVSNFWFLKSLFICYLICFFCWQTGSRKYIALGGVWCFLLALQHWEIGLYKTSHMLPFFVAGILLHKHSIAFGKYARAICGATLLLFCCLFPFYSLYCTFLAYQFKALSWTSILHYVLFLGLGLTGSLCVLSACCLIDSRWHKSKTKDALLRIGRSTLDIYLWQYLLVETLLPRLIHVDMPKTCYNLVFCPIVAAIGTIICYYLNNLFKHATATTKASVH